MKNNPRYILILEIAEFMYAVGRANPRAIADLKPSRNARPDFMYGWFHNDIGQNFMIDVSTMQITAFIDREGAAFTDFRAALHQAEHHWDKLGCRGFGVELIAAYARPYGRFFIPNIRNGIEFMPSLRYHIL